ncbi:MAG: carbon storage regulator [Planctomycetaceae bacterium]
MLVLTRKLGETIQIGDSIIVEVASVQGNRVRLAIKAPDDVKIRRGELTTSATLAPVTLVGGAKMSLPLYSNLNLA